VATDWTLEIVKFVLTPVLAGAGAYVGFLLSNRSKKHDLLYKEKMEAFKSLSTEMLKLRKASYIALMGTLWLDRADEDTSEATRAANQELAEFTNHFLYSSEDVTLFLSERSRTAMQAVQDALWGHVYAREAVDVPETLSWMKAIQQRECVLTDPEVRAYRVWGEKLEAVRTAAEEMINELYRDIGLPTLRPIFAADRTRYSLLARGLMLPALRMAVEASTVTVVSYEAFERAAGRDVSSEEALHSRDQRAARRQPHWAVSSPQSISDPLLDAAREIPGPVTIKVKRTPKV